MAIRDRVENRGRAPGSVEHRRVRVDERLHVRADPAGERQLGEDNRVVRQCRVKQCVAPAVRFETPEQIAPVPNLVHRLALDQLLEDGGRCSTVDPATLEEAVVEPRFQ